MLKDQHVRIHCHTDGQDNASHARQCQRSIQQVQQQQKDDGIGHQSDIRDKAGQAVKEQHKDKHCPQAHREGEHGLVLGILAQGRADCARLDDIDLDRQSTAAQHDSKILRLFQRALAGNLRLAADNRLTHVRCSQHLAVQQDGDGTAYIHRRKVSELFRPFIGECQIHHILPILVRCRLGVFQVRAGKYSITFLITEFKHCSLADGFNS